MWMILQELQYKEILSVTAVFSKVLWSSPSKNHLESKARLDAFRERKVRQGRHGLGTFHHLWLQVGTWVLPGVQKIYRFTTPLHVPYSVLMCKVCSHDSIYPLKWSEKWFSLRPNTIFARNNRWQNRKLMHCRQCLVTSYTAAEVFHPMWAVTDGRNIMTRRKILLGNQILTPCWASSWRFESGIVVQKFELAYDTYHDLIFIYDIHITFLYADVYLKTLMKCEGDIRKNRRITTSKSFEKSVQKTWKHHCWLCLSTIRHHKILLCHSCARTMWTKEPERCTAIRMGAMEPGLLMKRHSPRVKR